MARRARARGDKPPRLPRRSPVIEGESAEPSATAVTLEALRTGVVPLAVVSRQRFESIPHDDETLRVGDPDDRVLDNAYVGDETPGGSATTPDQNAVDEIGRAYGLQEEDSGALRSGAEVLERRDRHRDELRPPGRR